MLQQEQGDVGSSFYLLPPRSCGLNDLALGLLRLCRGCALQASTKASRFFGGARGLQHGEEPPQTIVARVQDFDVLTMPEVSVRTEDPGGNIMQGNASVCRRNASSADPPLGDRFSKLMGSRLARNIISEFEDFKK